jgi:hypothetical protein
MEYFTSPEQEARLHAIHRQQVEQEQDRIRTTRFISSFTTPRPIPPSPRIFFVEPEGHVYFGEIKPENECPHHLMAGGASYGVDALFLREVQDFTRRNERYMIVFTLRKEYSYRAGIYPARMVSDKEELLLEEDSVEV